MTLDIALIPVFSDNYVPIMTNGAFVAAVDPGDAAPVIAALAKRDVKLTDIFITHHHSDHIGGVMALKKRYGCTVTGPASEETRIPGMDRLVREGDTARFGEHMFRILETPGHTTGHISYWLPAEKILFCGDTLFSIGCGRLFEGTPQQMWDSLKKLRALPDDTRIYCAHEYTLANIRFALTVDPENRQLRDYAEKAAALRAQNLPTIPALLKTEKAANPFLRADDAGLQEKLGMTGINAADVFAEIRRRKDNF